MGGSRFGVVKEGTTYPTLKNLLYNEFPLKIFGVTKKAPFYGPAPFMAVYFFAIAAFVAKEALPKGEKCLLTNRMTQFYYNANFYEAYCIRKQHTELAWKFYLSIPMIVTPVINVIIIIKAIFCSFTRTVKNIHLCTHEDLQQSNKDIKKIGPMYRGRDIKLFLYYVTQFRSTINRLSVQGKSLIKSYNSFILDIFIFLLGSLIWVYTTTNYYSKLDGSPYYVCPINLNGDIETFSKQRIVKRTVSSIDCLFAGKPYTHIVMQWVVYLAIPLVFITLIASTIVYIRSEIKNYEKLNKSYLELRVLAEDIEKVDQFLKINIEVREKNQLEVAGANKIYVNNILPQFQKLEELDVNALKVNFKEFKKPVMECTLVDI